MQMRHHNIKHNKLVIYGRVWQHCSKTAIMAAKCGGVDTQIRKLSKSTSKTEQLSENYANPCSLKQYLTLA